MPDGEVMGRDGCFLDWWRWYTSALVFLSRVGVGGREGGRQQHRHKKGRKRKKRQKKSNQDEANSPIFAHRKWAFFLIFSASILFHPCERNRLVKAKGRIRVGGQKVPYLHCFLLYSMYYRACLDYLLLLRLLHTLTESHTSVKIIANCYTVFVIQCKRALTHMMSLSPTYLSISSSSFTHVKDACYLTQLRELERNFSLPSLSLSHT